MLEVRIGLGGEPTVSPGDFGGECLVHNGKPFPPDEVLASAAFILAEHPSSLEICLALYEVSGLFLEGLGQERQEKALLALMCGGLVRGRFTEGRRQFFYLTPEGRSMTGRLYRRTAE